MSKLINSLFFFALIESHILQTLILTIQLSLAITT
uniref:Uncharacterized protein LOC104221254 n=1 Tax=Nicotiana sylvestris TaxID=4096 RepID=A0A1U7VRR1_NICSY|nr:PREDICTED: uncharacterized protein LOC104221254 [Nicotiana sylvestris]